MPEAGPVRASADGIALTIRATTRARRDEIIGQQILSDGRAVLALKVRAIPADGAANAAIEALVARALDVSRGAASVASGHRGRIKIVHVSGDSAELAARAQTLTDGGRQ